MTRVVAALGEEVCSLSMEGHAGYQPGNDIVCAGLSAIMTALQGYLLNLPEDIRERCIIVTESGHCLAEAPDGALTRPVFQAAEIGCLQIQRAYPKFVEVSA